MTDNKEDIKFNFEYNFGECFIKVIEKKEDHRYLSWEHCYNYFQENVLKENYDEDHAALMLGFYLASWGMYRGSSQLLKRFSYDIHKGAVKIIKEHNDNKENKDNVDKLYQTLERYYNQKFGKGHPASDTLITKIIMGTTGQSPAYDRFFKSGIKCYNENRSDGKPELPQTFSQDNLKKISEEFQNNVYEQELATRPKIKYKEKTIEGEEVTKKIKAMKYPLYKVIDIYFWNLGRQYEEQKQNGKQKAEASI